MKKTLLTFFSTFILLNFANAQVSSYTFAQTSGTYTLLTGATTIASGTNDDSVISAKPIGFTFNYNGVNYTQFGLNVNGWISLGAAAPANSYTPISSGTTNNIISALGRDLQLGYTTTGAYTTGSNTVTMAAGTTAGFVPGDAFITSTGFLAGTIITAVGATTITLSTPASATGTAGTYTVGGKIQYLTSGTAPNRICTIQWSRARRYNATITGGMNNLFNFQIQLFETTNVINFVYGTFQTNATSSVYQVGLRGSTNTDFFNRKTTSDWAATTAGTLNTDTCSLRTTVLPASGQTFTFSPPPLCTGTPLAGNASGPTGACIGVPFNLVLANYSPNVSGLTFQWQSSTTSGGTYTDIAGATTSTYAATQTVALYYQCVVTCTGSGLSATTTSPVFVTMNSVSSCYCTPVHSSVCSASDNIDTVTILTTTLNNQHTGCTSTNGNAYTIYPATGLTTASLQAGNPYTFKITTTSNNVISVWIDYNQNGMFDSVEWKQVCLTSTANVANSVSITIPTSALGGPTAMRVRSRSTGSANGYNNSCTSFASGETEDYTITIVAAAPCSGTPVAGTASGPTGACSGASFNLSLTGYTVAAGITFQWQSSTTSGGTYTNIAGATSPTYTATQTVAMFYKCNVSCSGGTAVSSNIISVIINTGTSCYCIPPSTNCGSGDIITNVTISTINNTTTCGTAGYSAYTTPTATLYTSFSYPISVTVGTGGTEYACAWIDYNQNGIFELTEFTSLGSGNGVTINSNITIPNNATAGTTRMRVRIKYGAALTGAEPCIGYTYGETEDYTITIAAATPCSGAPTAGTAAGPASVCSGVNFALTLTGYTSGVSGLTFQWQSSTTSGGTYANIAGATSPNYTATQTAALFYKCNVSCSGGAPVSSNIINVTMNAVASCYCTPANSNCSSGDEILKVIFATINNSTTCSTGGYSTYPTPNPILNRGTNYPIGVFVGNGGTEFASVWIDYNQNGIFETSEFTAIGSGDSVLVNASIAIPTSAVLGSTIMRVRCKYNTALTGADACLAVTYGETEDYAVTISSTTGIEENIPGDIFVYPNPTAGIFTIRAGNVAQQGTISEVKISIIDIQGKEVFSSLDKNNSLNFNKQINLEGIAKGLYYIKLNTDKGVKIQKLIIQ